MATRHTLHALVVAGAALLAAPSVLHAQVRLTTVVSGLTQPVFVGHAGDGTNRLFIVERAGRIRVLPPGASMGIVFLDITSSVLSAGGEQGLLGLAFHPQYASNRRFFVFYTRKPDGALRVAEFRATSDPNVADHIERPLLTILHPGATNHNGGMLAFGRDGLLYISVGDGGGANDGPNNGQNLNSLLGKILRINVNTASGYLIPASNPFAGATSGRDEIYAYGLRNPWRFSVDRSTGQIWLGDVGQNAREEIDGPIVSGGNYGWRVFEGTSCTGNGPAPCNAGAYIAPTVEYAHAGGRCSVTGGYVYRGTLNTLSPGTYVYADYCTGEIFARAGGSSSLLLDTSMRISSFGEDRAGELLVVNYTGGTISRLTRTTTSAGTTTCTNSAPVAGWVCVGNNNWVPPDHPLALALNGGSGGTGGTGGQTGGGTTTPTCTNTAPVAGWVCVGNNSWVPPDHPLALALNSGSSGGTGGTGGTGSTGGTSTLPVCTNTAGAPGSGWVKVPGGWVPPDHPLAVHATCRVP
jgi:glucose/arabinose dehydrogenase